MSNIINYSSGGLANRILPILSSLYYSNLAKRNLSICWPSSFIRCQCSFNDLFLNHIPNLSFTELENLEDVVIYSNADAAQYEYNLNKTDTLLKLFNKYPIKPLSDARNIPNETVENVIVFSNKLLPDIPRETHKHSFLKLIPTTPIQDMIKECTVQLDKSWVGCHLRATDFRTDLGYYRSQMDSLYRDNKNIKFFICSDNPIFEKELKNSFPMVEFREKNNCVFKKNIDKDWVDNVETPMESIREALVDLYLLSKTTIKIYHPNSSFAQLALL